MPNQSEDDDRFVQLLRILLVFSLIKILLIIKNMHSLHQINVRLTNSRFHSQEPFIYQMHIKCNGDKRVTIIDIKSE